MKRIFISMIAMCMMMSLTVFAESSEWKDASYDFNTIKTVYVDTTIQYDANTAVSELDHLKNLKAIDDHAKQLKHFKRVDSPALADAVITLHVYKWGEEYTWIPPRDYTEKDYIEYVDEINDTKSQKEVVFDMHDDGFYSRDEFFDAEFIVTDKQGNSIYRKRDTRSSGKDSFSMFGRAIRDFYKSFNKINEVKR